MIKRIGLGATVAAAAAAVMAALLGPSSAADMPVKAPPVAAVAAPSWTGFYLNAGGGYGMWSADTTTFNTVANVCTMCLPIRQVGRGWFGTVGGGFDYQANANIVIGAFADYDFASIKGSFHDQSTEAVAQTKLDWAWSAGVRAGWLITPSILTYVTGGYTQAHFTGGAAVQDRNGAPFAPSVSYRGVTTSGWFIGGGSETQMLPGWFWRNEYRLARYDRRDVVACRDNGTGCGSAIGFDNIRFQPYVQTVRSELVYKFNWGGPAVASAPVAVANMPVKVRPAAPVAAVNWTGLYLNGGGGYGMWAADTTTHDDFNGFACRVCVPVRQGGRGGLATVGGGFDYQINPTIVVGAFADYDVASIKGSVVGDIGAPQPVFIAQTKLDWAWYVGARAGWVVVPRVLTYVSGGYARAHFTGGNLVDGRDGTLPVPNSSYRALTTNGWFVGGGAETQVWQGLFWRNEYRYARYSADDFVPCLNDGGGCGVIATNFNTLRFQPIVQTVRSEIVYKFNWGGPVAARY